MSSQIEEFVPSWAVPPGATLAETMEELGVSSAELARRINCSQQFITDLIGGQVTLTPAVAEQLENVLGVPGYIWLNLEKNYQEAVVRTRAAA